MTWHARVGEIILEGEESQLYRDVFLKLCDQILDAESDEESKYGGASVFDCMSRTQQLASLDVVARHLFFETQECLKLVAWSEATLATILSEIRSDLQAEIELGEEDRIRQVLLPFADEEFDRTRHWDSLEEWDFVFDCYEDRFLWDMDYEDTAILDLPPQVSSAVKQSMGILDEYHTAPPPDLRYEEELLEFPKRLWMSIDGKRTIRMTVTIETELPASLEIDQTKQTILGCFPSLIIMKELENGDAVRAEERLQDFFIGGSVMDHRIET